MNERRFEGCLYKMLPQLENFIRDGIVIYTGTLGSLKRYKDDVKEVAAGMDCGLNIENFNDIKVGDIIEGYTEKEIARKL